MAAVRSWPELGSHNQGVLIAWVIATIIMPTWRRLQPKSFRHARYRPLLERLCRTYAAGAPAATSVHLLTMRNKAQRLLKLQSALLFISGVVLHPDGLWGGLHVSRGQPSLWGTLAVRCGALLAACLPHSTASSPSLPPNPSQALSYKHLPWWQQMPAHASLWLGKRRLFRKMKKRRAAKAAKA